jgi:hypothetical protein
LLFVPVITEHLLIFLEVQLFMAVEEEALPGAIQPLVPVEQMVVQEDIVMVAVSLQLFLASPV